MDYLAKKREYAFWNNKRALVRVHVTQVESSPYNIWTEGKTKKYRDSISLIKKAIENLNPSDLPPIIVVANSKMGSGGISSYNHDDDVIYYNSYYHNQVRINQLVSGKLFTSKSVSDIIRHELGHKLHWDAVKRFCHANQTRYNSIEEAKNELDSKLENYISKQEINYLYLTLSSYAAESFRDAKANNRQNSVNEVIAEFMVKSKSVDSTLRNLIESELNYGKV